MTESGLLEITVQARTGERPEEVAQEWLHRLNLRDGVRVVVMRGETPTRPRRFVVYDGRITSPQHYAAVVIGDALEEVLRREGRAMDAWEILMAARRQESPLATVPMATINRAARLLVRARRLLAGPTPGSWIYSREDDEAA